MPCEFCGAPSVGRVEVHPAEDKGHDKAGRTIFRAAVRAWVCQDHLDKVEARETWEGRERAARRAQAADMEAAQMTLGQKL
jgi:hypothetical protein